jgi:UDP-N-acetylmuramoyl-L-alanyl-D-glutamate--2,6-diaminopimelate ligase
VTVTTEVPLDVLVRDAGLAAPVVGGAPAIRSVTHDSRRVSPGALFCCVRGATVDGHAFAQRAVDAGAAALVVETLPHLRAPVPHVVVPDSRVALAWLSAAFHGYPSRRLTAVGVTGTNGKTTTAHLLAAILRAQGPVGVMGTLDGGFTTPEAPVLQERLRGFADDGCVSAVMEVSSHSLALHRVDGTRFAAAVFTNLGRDHLDLHGTMEQYFAAKARLFTVALAERGVTNVDDVHGRLLLDAADIPMTTYGLADAADLVVTPTSLAFTWRGARLAVPIGGDFNVSNVLAAATTAHVLGMEPDDIGAALAVATPVPGRFEPVDAGQDFAVVVDYAHTPDGLAKVLQAARAAASGRVLVVFGAGGDRDREKRPEMGAVVARGADVAVVTSDNPRSEDPLAIITSICSGMVGDYRATVIVEPDRRAAIAAAFREARPGDVVVIAGKGHETTQTLGTHVVPFDDRHVARELLEHGS